MKINVNTGKRTLKMRILSAFMAVLIFSLTSPELFENLGVGLIVHGAIPNLTAGSGTIDSSTTQISKYMGQSSGTGAVRDSHNADGTTSNGTYTGRIRPVTVSMYDYLTDGEINGTWNVLNDNNYTWYYRYDPYTKFNNAISQTGGTTTIKSAQSYNITIKYYGNNKFSSSDTVYIYLWNANKNSGWTNHKMSFDNVNSCFYFTFSTTNENYIGFTPDRIIFHDNGSKKSPDILQTMTAGNTYTFTENTSDGKVNYRLRLNSSNTDAHIYPYNSDTDKLSAWRGVSMTSDGNDYYSYTQNNNTYKKAIFNGTWGQYPGSGSSGFGTSGGYTYFYNWGNSPAEFIQWPNLDVTTSTGSENITEITGGLSNPLYTGYFIHPDDSGRPSYNNFYWMPNLAQTSDSSANADAAVQGLVDATLNADGLVQKDGIALPYFDSTWASNHKYNTSNQTYSSSGNKDIMKCWESTDSKKISFPFYETLQATTTEGQYAKYYQFNSKDSNLVFHNNDTTPADSYFEETETVIKDVYEGSGFFPYNTTSSIDSSNREKNCKNNNYGFGTKFEMTFKLGENGMAEAVDENGKKITTGIADTVPMKFEFDGDDDLWVFIDGNLVLDIGGAHGASKGEIDFSTAKAKVDKLVQYNDTNKDKLDADVNTSSTTTPNVVSLEDKIIGLTMNGNTPTYDTSVTHKMTIFYMERGMAQSNLYVRYNFIPEDTFTKMKIKEQTDFSGVNKGLKAITQKAADRDVFKYTVSNNGTNADDVYHNTYTNKAFTRTVQGENTQLTTAGTISNKNFNPSSYDTVADVAYNWVDEYASVNGTKMESSEKAAGITGSSGELYLMHGIAADLTTGLEVKSSAEFEGQFKRYSTMTIVQDANLYTPNKNNTPATLSTNPSVARSVSQYYTTTKSISSNTHRTPVVLDDNVNTFKFRNDINASNITEGDATNYPDTGVHIDSAAQVTELFVNTVNTGEISVTKEVTNEVSNEDVFEFTLSISDVFGVSGVLVGSNQYGSIDITGDATNSTGTGSATKLTSDGKFYIKGNGTVTISGIPVGTKYTITESTHTNYTSSTSPSSENQTIANGTLDTSGSSTVYVHSTKSYTITNTRRIGNLVLNKTLVNSTTPGSFNFAVTLNAPTGVSLSGITLDNVALSTQPTSGTSFTVTVPVTSGTTGQVTLGGIPYGTTYTVTETSGRPTGDGAGVTGEVTTPQTIDGVDDSVNIINTFPEVHEYPVTVTKTGNTGDNMSGAELELWYKETITPSTYSYNDPKPVPSQKMNGLTVTDTDKTVGVPGLAVTTEKTKNYTNYIEYTNPTVPNSDEKEWILPRNDSDYIYFRDFNTGTYTADKDAISFSSNSANNSAGKRSWVETTFAANGSGTHYQDQELGFANTNLWVAAQFTGNGKQMVQYAVWERFVDKFTYTDHNNTSQTVDTVVWKIQPPDGYNKVRFLAYDGNNCIRTTEEFTYQLGRIYHKTNWGGSYSPAYGGSYYDVPVNKDDAPLWAPAANGTLDRRNTAMEQARKYEPTEQKVIFTCDSSEVWHNIHIEFFTTENNGSPYTVTVQNASGTGTTTLYPVNGQPFPGYMMEPYAYAQSNYRLPGANDHQYLTYELTIPKGATHFRINNGVDNSSTKGKFNASSGSQSPYAFRTEITALKKTNGTKNYNNYYAFSSTVTNTVSSLSDGNPYDVSLVEATSGITALSGENTAKTYSTVEVESDYDFIYFEWPSSWGNTPGKVYAYFYGGGNLREDNWQRACYSAWPGVAPVGTEYVYDSTNVYSTTYTYPTNSKYNGNTATSAAIPEATFSSGGKTIYRFRIPKGDRKNYSKVIFNNGLGSGNETGVIEYKRGYIYNKHGNATKHYENSPTMSYTANTVSGNTEYIYVHNGPSWSDLHVTFYDANGGQILQGGSGYLMEYAGDDYYKIPLPTDAKYVSVNNGMNGSLKSEKAEIIRLDSAGSPKATAAASDRFVYNLTSDKKLTRDGIEPKSSYTEDTNILPQEEVNTDYASVRRTGGTDDVLYICDEYGWNADIGAVSVKFYKADGTSAGSGVMMKTNPDSDNNVWYTKKIPTDAASFVVGYYNGSSSVSTPSYPIYPTTGDGNKTTSGNMFYKTASVSTLKITHANASSTPVNDETYDQRGDDLYLVKSGSGAMRVTFYGAGDVTIRSGITAKYINVDDNSDHWFKVSIPTGAKSFSIDSDSSTKYDIYELKAKYSPYQKDYTVGDMQYRVGNTTPLYPVFTEDDEYTTELGGKEISSRSPAPQVEDSAVESYATANAYPLPTSSASSPSDTPVLYETSVNNVKYKWTEGTEDLDYECVRFENADNWTTPITANFNGTTVTAESTTGTSNGHTVYYFRIPSGTQSTVYFTNGTKSTVDITLAGNGHGYMYYPATLTDSTYSQSFTQYNGNYLVQVRQPSGAAGNVDISVTSTTTGEDWRNYLWVYLGTSNSNTNPELCIYNTDGTRWDNGNTYSGNSGYWADGKYFYRFTLPSTISSYNQINVLNKNNDWKFITGNYPINSSNSYGVGYIIGVGGSTTDTCDGNVYNTIYFADANGATWYGIDDLSNNSTYVNAVSQYGTATTTYSISSVTYPSTVVSSSGGSVTTLTYTYQPEDRYGMISVDNSASTPVTLGMTDANDFIKIVGANDLYIKFFDAQNNELGTSDPNTNTKGLKIAYASMVNVSNNTDYASSAQPGAGTAASPYMVRIPKGAQSFTITNGDGTRSGTYDLSPSTITVNETNGQLTSSGNQITLTDFYHAGSTFTVADSSTAGALDITLTDVRDGYTVARQTSMTDPLNPRTDADYIFFTDDSSNTFGGSGSTKTVYAYFYGDKDGEYTAWPGIKATTANTSVAETTYTDNAGRTVYMFRVPQTADGKYKYVIFNDGSTTNSRKITQAVQYVKGSNYYLVPSADNTTPYGTITSSTYAVTNENKATNASTVGYNTAGTNKYIYIINNGTKDLAGATTTAEGAHTALDEMHVTFFDGNKTPIGDGAPGYKPDRVVANVYRIQAPADAKYFQINNGANKGTGDPSRIRQSEIKQLSPNGLYKFVDAAYLTSLGKDNTVAANYIEGNSVPASANDCWKPNYLLALTNPRVMEDGDPPVPETYDVHIATVVTKADGTVDYIKWVKNSPSNIDSNYIANVSGDIGPSGNHTQNVKVVKQGDYYWKEVVAPSGYQINPANIGFNVTDTNLVITTVNDPPNPTGQLTLNKKLATVKSTANSGENQNFTFNVTLTAPVGTKWQTLNTSSPLTFQTKTGSNTAVTVTPTSDVYSDTNLTRTISISIPATGLTDYIIGNIPSGTYYSVTETSPTDYSDEPVAISETMYTGTTPTSETNSVDDMEDTIPSYTNTAHNAVSYAVTNKRKVGGLTLEKVADGEYAAAGVNVTNNTTHEINYTEFTYTVTLTAPENVDFRDYIKWADFTALGATVTKINGTAVSGTPETDFNNAAPLRTIEFTVKVKANNGSKLVKNLPIGTKYTVTEVDPTSPIDTSNWSKSGEVTTATEMTPTNLNPTVTITNTFGSCEIVLTKTAKEKVGTTDIGSPLAGAAFLVYKNDGDSNDTNDVLAGKFTQAKNASNQIIKGEYNFNNTSGTFNVIDENDNVTPLVTGDDSSVTDHYGKLILKGLPVGDYYLKEIKAPEGYSNLDSNNLKNGVAQPKRIYFSVGENTKTKEISCADEMDAAYIRLFEHIDEYRPDEWGNPTFIFKIKRTKHYELSSDETPVWKLPDTDNDSQEFLVALTVDENGYWTEGLTAHTNPSYGYNTWYEESTKEFEYKGMYHIGTDGKIRVEPGEYEITRIPASRYEFVENTWKLDTDDDNTYDTKRTSTEKLTITVPATKTATVHYYDKVAYYDKFSQVDTRVNKFYTLDSTTKKNKTIKGIRIADYHQVGKTGTGNDTVDVTDNSVPPVTTRTMTVPVANLKIYKVYVDGSEELMSNDDYAALSDTNFNITYTYDSESGDKREFGGKAAEGNDPAIPNQFSYSKTNKQITVTKASDFENGVYTLTATYTPKQGTTFTTNFDLVFLRSST